jgi:hypothetical protein
MLMLWLTICLSVSNGLLCTWLQICLLQPILQPPQLLEAHLEVLGICTVLSDSDYGYA